MAKNIELLSKQRIVDGQSMLVDDTYFETIITRLAQELCLANNLDWKKLSDDARAVFTATALSQISSAVIAVFPDEGGLLH